MSDERANMFQVRRPMLQHVADALRNDIVELLSDEGIEGVVAFRVASTQEFLQSQKERTEKCQNPLVELTDQVSGYIDVRIFDAISQVERVVAQLLTIHSSRWYDSESGQAPSLKLLCVIPPQAMPEGWRARSDVPQACEMTIRVVGNLQDNEGATSILPLYSLDGGAPFPLIMKGGGIKGLAYVGAIAELAKRYSFNWYVGTSAGAITAILLGAGYTHKELEELMAAKDFRDFFDASWYAMPFNLLVHHGLYKAQAFTDWLDDLLAKKLQSPRRVRLSDLPNRVTVYACRRGQRTLRFDSVDSDADAAYAARCSMSIPLVFTPESDQGINTYDGGMHQNYPIDQLLSEHPGIAFISLYLGSETYKPVRQRWVISDLISIWTEGGDADAIAKYRDRTVIIDPSPIGTLDFALTDDEKQFLLACGRCGAISHLSNGSEEHFASKNARDELRVKVSSQRADQRKSVKRRRIKILVAILIALAAYASYKMMV